MKPLLFCLAATATAAAVSAFVGLSNPGVTRDVVNPGEPMVVVPGLEKLGPSRLSTVTFCASNTGSGNWQQLVTDLQFDRMDACLQENT
jgi:hypothetical protein